MTRGLLLALLLALSGCGSRQALQPAPGATLPPRPAGAVADPTPEQLLAPDTQARPGRSDEVLRRSEERRDDPFDLPPPG